MLNSSDGGKKGFNTKDGGKDRVTVNTRDGGKIGSNNRDKV